jgi:hypothetical protein
MNRGMAFEAEAQRLRDALEKIAGYTARFDHEGHAMFLSKLADSALSQVRHE